MRGQKKSLLPTDSPSFDTCSPFSQGGPRKRLALGTTDSLLCSLSSQRFYNQVSTPLLKKIQFNYPQESVSDVTQSSFHNYFGGSEIVVAGKVDTANLQHLESVVTATAVSGALSRIPALGVWAASFTRVYSLLAGYLIPSWVLDGSVGNLTGVCPTRFRNSFKLQPRAIAPWSLQKSLLLARNVIHKIQLQTRICSKMMESSFMPCEGAGRPPNVSPFMAETSAAGDFKQVALHGDRSLYCPFMICLVAYCSYLMAVLPHGEE